MASNFGSGFSEKRIAAPMRIPNTTSNHSMIARLMYARDT